MQVISAEQAAEMIQSNMTVGIGGFGAWSGPDAVLHALAKRYAKTKEPKNLTVVCGVSPGSLKDDEWGLNSLKEPGLLGTIIAPHIGMPPAIGHAVGTNQIAGFTPPLGVYGHLLRAMAGKKPGVLTHVGLHTFADPRLDGCRVNGLAKDSGREIVSLVEIDGKEYLMYHTFPIDICVIRCTYADEDGNISFEDEALISEQREMALAVHNNGGKVIVQVKKIVSRGCLNARDVMVHRNFVDYVVVASEAEHPQGYDFPEKFRPELLGGIRVPASSMEPIEMSLRKIVARRAAMELRRNVLVNLGIGIPDGVAKVANEEGILDDITLSIESGTIGGIPVGGAGLGASVNPEAVYPIALNFDMYDGGGLDMAFLGAAEIDENGNVNVSKFGTRCTGPGGFINISQNTPKICFMGLFTAGKTKACIENGELHIEEDGSGIKFRKSVEQITFSSEYAKEAGQEILYVTERAVFRIGGNGLILTEIAPGVDLHRDILDKMEFCPEIAEDLKEMDQRIFLEDRMGVFD